MSRRLPAALLLIWQLLAPSGIVWVNVLPAHIVQSGAEFARAFQLAPGVALTQEQVIALAVSPVPKIPRLQAIHMPHISGTGR